MTYYDFTQFFIIFRGLTDSKTDAFRSWYGKLSELRSLCHSYLPFIALTATAKKETRTTIIENLLLTNPLILTALPERKNIKYIFFPV